MSVRYATHRGQKSAYEVFGSGDEAVVLNHAFIRNRSVWTQFGYVDALAADFRVIAIDALAHGESDAPGEAARYRRDLRAGDVAAVLDAEGIAAAHYVGYSMGAWLGIGMLAHRPERLLSLTLGAFDPDPNGMIPPPFEVLLAAIGQMMPSAVAGLTAHRKAALALCYAAIGVRDIPASVVLDSLIPLHLWTGAEDTTFLPFKTLLERVPGAALSIVPGNHATAMSARESIDAVCRFVKSRK